MRVAVNREYAIACSFEPQGERGTWTFWFERWVGSGTYWICHPTAYALACRAADYSPRP